MSIHNKLYNHYSFSLNQVLQNSCTCSINSFFHFIRDWICDMKSLPQFFLLRTGLRIGFRNTNSCRSNSGTTGRILRISDGEIPRISKLFLLCKRPRSALDCLIPLLKSNLILFVSLLFIRKGIRIVILPLILVTVIVRPWPSFRNIRL